MFGIAISGALSEIAATIHELPAERIDPTQARQAFEDRPAQEAKSGRCEGHMSPECPQEKPIDQLLGPVRRSGLVDCRAVDRGETPTVACEREIREELGLDRRTIRVLVHDWAPNEKEGDKLPYVFDCGELGADEQRIQLDGNELDHWEWVEVATLSEYVIPRLARRLVEAYRAKSEGRTFYLEQGAPIPRPEVQGVSNPRGQLSSESRSGGQFRGSGSGWALGPCFPAARVGGLGPVAARPGRAGRFRCWLRSRPRRAPVRRGLGLSTAGMLNTLGHTFPVVTLEQLQRGHECTRTDQPR